MSATTKIALTTRAADLKNTTDDALPNYLHSLKFKQIHTHTDVRLVLGYSAVIIAGTLFYFDWKFGWEATKAYTAPAVVAYFVLNSVFTYWIWFVEAGCVFEGEGKTGKIRIASSTDKHIPIYKCDVTFTPAPYSSNPQQKLKIRAPFTRWFTADGYFVAKPFQQWLASEVPVVGAADPNNVIEEIGRGSETERVLNVTGNNAIDVLEQLKAGAKAGGGSSRRRK
ncbi:microsomal signal peptidase 25 kDa subunit-domain-containing protein [Clohesyomyces aquaticus]|uniref:Signal peptidase complex subunit 2 n=1 Tax=Clohesyomyces aquaticus TaxID=1231657 RepID=A0A1Y1Z1C5_9PLEO|nr:microsomal signal peptidase 25 kDa subunit-domain-containing protein [Clohesyomyces aquaticus]